MDGDDGFVPTVDVDVESEACMTTTVVASSVDRLVAEFEDRLTRSAVSEVMRTCIDDLEGTPAPAMPELSERLARQRLIDYLDAEAPR